MLVWHSHTNLLSWLWQFLSHNRAPSIPAWFSDCLAFPLSCSWTVCVFKLNKRSLCRCSLSAWRLSWKLTNKQWPMEYTRVMETNNLQPEWPSLLLGIETWRLQGHGVLSDDSVPAWWSTLLILAFKSQRRTTWGSRPVWAIWQDDLMYRKKWKGADKMAQCI